MALLGIDPAYRLGVPPGLVLTTDVIRNMGIASIVGPSSSGMDEQCNGIAFSDSGNICVSSHNGASLRVQRGDFGGMDPTEGRSEYLVEETGCRLVTYTHHDACVLHTAMKGDGEERGKIAYHSLHDNKIIRFFSGHKDYVTAISMSPLNDMFITASKDGTFKVWDLRTPSSIAGGEVGAVGLSTAAFDHDGTVFGVASPSRTLALYESRMFGQFYNSAKPLLQYTVHPTPVKGPDGSLISPPPPLRSSLVLTSLDFSPDGRYLALGTADRGVLLADSLHPNRELALLQSHPFDPRYPCNAVFSPDGKFLTAGGCDGHIYAYDVSGKPAGIPIGAEARDMKLDELPYAPKRWEPSWNIMGEAHKTAAALATAKETAAAHTPKINAFMLATWMKRPDAQLPACPLAASADEQVSRHDGPVRMVRWHPRADILASGSQSVAIWAPSQTSVPPIPGFVMY